MKLDRARTLAAAISWRTAVHLAGGMLAGVGAGFAVYGLPMHVPESTKNVLSAVPTLGLITASGALWGRSIGGLLDPARQHKFTWAGGLSFGPVILLTGLGLTLLEVLLVEEGAGPAIAIYVLYTLLFVPATALVAGAGAFAVGLAAGSARLARDMALKSGLAAGLAFLIVNLTMDALGWRVGAPGAAERATMLTVTAAGALAAALAGGWVLGRALAATVATADHGPQTESSRKQSSASRSGEVSANDAQRVS